MPDLLGPALHGGHPKNAGGAGIRDRRCCVCLIHLEVVSTVLLFVGHFFTDPTLIHTEMSVSSFEVNAAAAMRDYYVEPRLGTIVGRSA